MRQVEPSELVIYYLVSHARSWSLIIVACPYVCDNCCVYYVSLYLPHQGGNKVCFFNADPIYVRKFLILDSKSVTNFGP